METLLILVIVSLMLYILKLKIRIKEIKDNQYLIESIKKMEE